MATNSAKQELNRLRRLARKRRIVVEVTGGSHLRWTAPDGRWTTTPLSPGEGRSLMNIRANLRRIGLGEERKAKREG